MPRDFLYETAITIDHEDDLMLVDTTQAGIASALLRCGFTETTKLNSRPYRRFRGFADQIRFRQPKGLRPVKGAAKIKSLERLHGDPEVKEYALTEE